MNIKKIIRLLFHPTTIKIVGLICIVGFFFILPTYAANTTDNEMLKKTQEFLATLLSLCSRGWVVLAIIAGKLMTNDFVYGAFIHMDIYLWKIRNIMKNFANFALAGLVLVSIVKGLVGKEALDVKKVITNTLVAGILIQASRFLMGAAVDISTIATAGISAFPMSFLKNDITLQNNITKSITTFKAKRGVIDLTTQSTDATNMFTNEPEPNQSLSASRKNILPNQNSVSGPFIYLGMAVFSFQNYLTTGQGSTDVPTLTLGFALRFFLLFLFTVGLFLMLIANIMRIGLLWIFIVGSPFLILVQVFNKKAGGGLEKIFNIGNLISAIFKPVIFVAGMSLMLIVIVSIQNSIEGSGATRENNLNGVSLTKSGDDFSIISVPGISSISINQKDILGANVIGPNALGKTQNFFSKLIMLLLSLFLMRQFIKLSLTLGGGTIEETMKGLIKSAEGMAKTMPILPGGLGYSGARSVMTKNKAKMLGGFGVNADGEFGQMGERGAFEKNSEKFDKFIADKMGMQHGWTENDYKSLDKLAKDQSNYTSFFSTSIDLAKQKEGGLSINDTRWMTNVALILSTQNKYDAINGKLDPTRRFTSSLPGTSDDQIKTYFGNPQNAQALYYLMGGFDATKKAAPNGYADLQNMSFYPNKQ